MRNKILILCNIYLLLIQSFMSYKMILFNSDSRLNLFPLKILFMAVCVIIALVYEKKRKTLTLGGFLPMIVLVLTDLFFVQKWWGSVSRTVMINVVFWLLAWIPLYMYIQKTTKGIEEEYYPDEIFSIYCTSYAMYFFLLLYLYFEETNIISIIVSVATSIFIDVLRFILLCFHNKYREKIKVKRIFEGAVLQLICTIIVLFLLPYNKLDGFSENGTVTLYIGRLVLIAIAAVLVICLNPANKFFIITKNEYNAQFNNTDRKDLF